MDTSSSGGRNRDRNNKSNWDKALDHDLKRNDQNLYFKYKILFDGNFTFFFFFFFVVF